MKKIITILAMAVMGTAYGQADTDIVNIPDKKFKEVLLGNYKINRNGDNKITYAEARAYNGEINAENRSISDLTGIEAFVNITKLHIIDNELTNLDVSKNTALQSLLCYNNQLTSLDVSKNTALQLLNCSSNRLTSLDVSKNIVLEGLDCLSNRLTSLDVSKNVTLINLRCADNGLTRLDVSENTALQWLDCSKNRLKSLDLSKNTALQRLSCYNNQLTSLDVSKNVALTYLTCGYNQLTKLDTSRNTLLRTLICGNNSLRSLDLSKNIALSYLYISGNQLTSLDVSKNPELKNFYCYSNRLTSLDVSKNPKLTNLHCYNNQLTQLNLANGNNKYFLFEPKFTKNPNLMCVQIDSGFTPTSSWEKDDHVSYSDNCNYPTLSTTEVKAENAIQILNPVKDNLVIKTTAKVESIEIYNTAGQLVKVLFRGNTQMQDLAKGIYLIKITTDKGVITEKIIKQ